MVEFKDIASELTALHERKNQDYGNAFGKSYNMYEGFERGSGLKYAMGRLGDKMTRLQNLVFTGKTPNNESIEDTLMDLAAYTIMTLTEWRQRHLIVK